MADTLERAKGPVFFHLQVTLPRELSPASREALADDIRECTVGRYPHSWAIHEPMATDGSGIQPHLHIQFSTRREDVEHYKPAEEWFRQAPRGVAKDASWFAKGRLHDVRASVALLTNAALQREGIVQAVDHRTLEAQGISRDPARYASTHDHADLDYTMAYRQHLRESGTLAYEQLATYGAWQDQRRQLPSIDRQCVLDRCRDHVWRYDKSPVRERERQQSMERTLHHVMDRGRAPVLRQDRTMAQTRERQQVPAHQRLRDLAASLDLGDEAPTGSGLRVRLHPEERDREYGHGLGW
jgi:hypothetical protein